MVQVGKSETAAEEMLITTIITIERKNIVLEEIMILPVEEIINIFYLIY